MWYSLNGWGASLVDGLDTMILMGLDDLSNRSVEHVAKLTFNKVSILSHDREVLDSPSS